MADDNINNGFNPTLLALFVAGVLGGTFVFLLFFVNYATGASWWLFDFVLKVLSY